MPADLQWLLFSFRGRVNRATFAMIALGQFAFTALIESIVFRNYVHIAFDQAHKPEISADIPSAVGSSLLLLGVAMVWISLANHCKRLHDFGWSGWRMAWPMGAVIAGLLPSMLLALLGLPKVALGLMIVCEFAAALGGLALVAMMFFRRGDDGGNKYDRGPGGGQSAKAAFHPSRQSAEYALPVYRPPQARPQSFGRRKSAA